MHDNTKSPIRPSAFTLPRGDWCSVLDCLCARFPEISRERWLDRMQRGLVQDMRGHSIDVQTPHREGMRIIYFREVANEKPIPFQETILYADNHLIVADKPHFLPVIPAGNYVEETLLTRLTRQLNNPDLTPLHRIDRHTAGLVLFSANKTTRAQYQALFRERTIIKTYEAIAPALPQLQFPHIRTTRLVRGDPFVLSKEVDGEPNTETRIEVSERHGDIWRYTLYPVTGKKHQLRVHMAALGAPIRNDPMYPIYRRDAADDYSRPLQLLAKALHFVDPVLGIAREFESRMHLDWQPHTDIQQQRGEKA